VMDGAEPINKVYDFLHFGDGIADLQAAVVV
jgi:hypothetical protein